METISKDQQIKSQAETIESLNKKLETLKMEFDNSPDKRVKADKIKIQIESDQQNNINDFKIHCYKMQEALSVLLQINENQQGKYIEFAMLRDQLLKNTNVQQFQHNKNFMNAIYLLSRITDRMMALRMLQWIPDKDNHRDIEFGAAAVSPDRKTHLKYWQSISRIIMGAQCANDTYMEYSFTNNLASFVLIQNCLSFLQPSLSSDYSEIKICIDTIVFYLESIVNRFEVN